MTGSLYCFISSFYLHLVPTGHPYPMHYHYSKPSKPRQFRGNHLALALSTINRSEPTHTSSFCLIDNLGSGDSNARRWKIATSTAGKHRSRSPVESSLSAYYWWCLCVVGSPSRAFPSFFCIKSKNLGTAAATWPPDRRLCLPFPVRIALALPCLGGASGTSAQAARMFAPRRFIKQPGSVF